LLHWENGAGFSWTHVWLHSLLARICRTLDWPLPLEAIHALRYLSTLALPKVHDGGGAGSLILHEVDLFADE
jgi:hypothetical protein